MNLATTPASAGNTLTAVDLRCNDSVNPIGVDSLPALLSWVPKGAGTDRMQSAWQIRATAADASRLLWDSGKVLSDRTWQIPYGGPVLRSSERIRWQVRLWDETGTPGTWSEEAAFEAGLLCESDWKGKWIGSPKGGTDIDRPIPAPLFRKEIPISSPVVSARAHVCGLGYHELYVNGHKVDDTVLRSAFTRYDATVLYDSYDITELVRKDTSTATFGVILGNGWYNCFTPEVWDFRQAPWRHQPKFLLQIRLIHADGSETVVVSDTSWKTGDSAIRFDGLRNGEFYDARCEVPGWNRKGFDDRAWIAGCIVRSPGGRLRSFQMPPIRVTRTLKPLSVKEVKPGIYICDMGENLSGWIRMKAAGPAGTETVFRYSEQIHENGTIDPSKINTFVKGGEFQTDKYCFAGTGEMEEWEPRFTYHGFRYVEITGFPGIPTVAHFEGHVVHTDLPPRGRFSCSDPVINAIQLATEKATLTNYHGIPTDCPHREKNGWTGDAGLSAEQVIYNHDPRTAYAKWLGDFLDAQRPSGQLPGIIPTGGWGYNWGSGPAWDSAMLHISWYLYLYDGDLAILERMYEGMKRYVEFAEGQSENGLVHFGLGDWCPPVGDAQDHKCPTKVTDTAYFAVDADIVARTARLLGKLEDAERFEALARTIREAFMQAFVDSDTGSVLSDSQTSLACALYQNMVPVSLRGKVFDRLVEQVEAADRHIDCGILGAKYVIHVLYDMGRADLAHAITVNPTFPGWGNWMAKGATTLRETWNDDSSQNHHMFSDISAWFYRGLGGILPDPDAPGFRHTFFRPNPVPGMDWVEAEHESPLGKVAIVWRREAGDAISYTLTVPVNGSATFHFPLGQMPEDGGSRVRKLGSGIHCLRAVIQS